MRWPSAAAPARSPAFAWRFRSRKVSRWVSIFPVIPISSLAALAQDAPPGDASILAVIDARMGEIYAGAFRRKSDGLVESLGAESVSPAGMLVLPDVSKYTNGQWSVVGSGWAAYHDVLTAGCANRPRGRTARGIRKRGRWRNWLRRSSPVGAVSRRNMRCRFICVIRWR